MIKSQMTPRSAAEQAEEYADAMVLTEKQDFQHVRLAWLAGHAAGRAEAEKLAQLMNDFVNRREPPTIRDFMKYQKDFDKALARFKAVKGE